MAKNDFKPFATGKGANVTSQPDWEALPALLSGFTAGKASSAQVNKALRQASFIAAALAQYTASKSGQDVLDDGDLSGFIAKMSAAFGKDFQTIDATLTALAGLATGADKLPYFTGNDTAGQTDITSVGRDIIGKASIADILTYLGLEETAKQAAGAMQKDQNGADIVDKSAFLEGLGLGSDARLSGNLTVKGGFWDTAPGNTPQRVWSPNNKPSLATLGVLDATITQKGIVELATNAEMAAGSSSSLVPSVAAVMSLFSKKDFGGNNYIRIPDRPGGLIIEWGYVANAPKFQTFANITFPLAFPNNAQTVLATRQFLTASTSAQANLTVRNVLPTGFQLNLGDAESVNAYWLAIGC